MLLVGRSKATNIDFREPDITYPEGFAPQAGFQNTDFILFDHHTASAPHSLAPTTDSTCLKIKIRININIL